MTPPQVSGAATTIRVGRLLSAALASLLFVGLTALAVTSEAFVAGAKAGLDADMMVAVLNAAAAALAALAEATRAGTCH